MSLEKYQFPDEVPVTNNDDTTEYEVEIEDDTPEEDRGRTPADPERVKQLEIEVDDLDKYSKDAKDKMIRMKRVWNDERRAKEAAERERQAAIEAAQNLYADNQRMRDMMAQGEQEYREAKVAIAKQRLKQAKKALKQANEVGDSEAMADAIAEMNQYQAELNIAENFKLPTLQKEKFEVQPAQQTPKPSVPAPDNRAMQWQDENPWFGQDPEMSATALGIHEKLSKSGVLVGSEEYYAELDDTMRRRYPEKFGRDAKHRADSPKAKASTVVAPATRTTGPKRVRINQSQALLAKKLGLTPEQYVRELMKLES